MRLLTATLLSAVCLIALAQPSSATPKSFELLVVHHIGTKTEPQIFAVIDGGYTAGVEPSLTADVRTESVHGDTIKVADLVVVDVDRFESACLITPIGTLDAEQIRRACARHCKIILDIPPMDSAGIQQRAISAMGEADYERAAWLLGELIDRYETGPSLQKALDRCRAKLDEQRTAGLSPEDMQLEKAKIPTYEELLEHYYSEGRYAMAEHKIQVIRNVDPDNPTAARYARMIAGESEPKQVSQTIPEYDLANRSGPPNLAPPPRLITPFAPLYPDSLKKTGVGGEVRLRSLINEEGNVVKTVIVKSAGHFALDAAAVKASYQTRWMPGAIDGIPTEVWVTHAATFTPKGRKSVEFPEVKLSFADHPGAFVLDVYPEMIQEKWVTVTDSAQAVAPWIKALVNVEGKVDTAAVHETSGIPTVDDLAVAAAYKNIFKPGKRIRQAVPVWVIYQPTIKTAESSSSVDPGVEFPKELGPNDAYPELIYEEPPVYPEDAEEKGVTGTVWISALVNEHGKVVEAHVKESSGHKAIDAAALAAAYKNKFKPGMLNGEPVRVRVFYKIEFDLESW